MSDRAYRSGMSRVPAMGSERLLLVLAGCFFVFHHAPSLAGNAGDWIDLATPFAVVAATAAVLCSLPTARAATVLALIGGLLYVDGHGIHLAANSIGHETLSGDAKSVTHFWDETFGHIEWHLGWMTLIAAIALAEAYSQETRTWRPRSYPIAVATAALLGFTLFTGTVEGGTWWLELAAAVVFLVWTLRAPRPLLVTCAGAFALAAALIGVWAIWHGGVPQFSQLGWL
ncbi:MAG TPA: hypothetical protein VF101_06240 [Gaiellaceae bacterium]